MRFLHHAGAASLIFLVSIAIYSGKVGSDTGDQQEVFTVIDSFISELEEKGFNGSILVAKGNDLFKKGYGYADKENRISNKPETVFDIGSVTKQFTGAAILKLEMQGKLSVNDPITKYFTGVPNDKRSITIHHLLTHSSGFKHGLGGDYDALRKDQFLSEAFQSTLLFPPGDRYEYSNIGYSILAAIIEKKSGTTYDDYLNKNLFQPAGMRQTGYTVPEWKTRDIANGYRGDSRWGKPNEKPWAENGPYWNLLGNGGILSTVEDLYRWHLALLGDNILNVVAKEKYYRKHIEEGDGSGTYYGYGWGLNPTPRNTLLVNHNGSNGIFFCAFLRYLEEDITIILLCNSFRREFHTIANEAAHMILNPGYQPMLAISEESSVGLDQHPEKELIKEFVNAVISGNKSTIEQLVNTKFTQRMADMVPMEKHVQMLSGLGREIGNGEITGVTLAGNETKIRFRHSPAQLTLIIQNGKIGGVLIGD